MPPGGRFDANSFLFTFSNSTLNPSSERRFFLFGFWCCERVSAGGSGNVDALVDVTDTHVPSQSFQRPFFIAYPNRK